MKYLIMIHGDQIDWDAWTDEEKNAFAQAHYRLADALAESGELVVSEGLEDPQRSTMVSVRSGETLVTDGPFAEVKEHLAGFYLVDCSHGRAVEIAAQVPDASHGVVEVRPVLDSSGWEM